MDSRVKRRKFGNTGLYVSEVSLGAMNVRMLDNTEQAYTLLNHVIDCGINLIDTARGYTGTNKAGEFVESEVLVGNVIRNRKDIDEPIVIVTKGHGYDSKDYDGDLHTSLGKLGIEGKGTLKIGDNEVRLVYFYHGLNADRWKTMKETKSLEKAIDYKKQGVISHIGFSSHYGDTEAIKEALDTGIFEVIELPYNIFNRSLGGDGGMDLIKYAYDRGVAVINMKAFSGNSMPPIYNILREYVNIDYSSMLDFCLSNKYISTVDAGTRYPEEFDYDINVSCSERMSKEKMDLLIKEADKISFVLKGICRECMHCMEKFECPQKVDFPGILAIYSRYRIVNGLGRDASEYVKQYQRLLQNATECIECGQCMPWCDYKLKIPQMLKKAHEVLGSVEV